jgi:hypothetical protein
LGEKEAFSWPSRLARYFLHGIAFSFLFLLLGLVWIVILVILVVVAFIIGFIIGIILLFFFMGGLNTFLTDFIWSATIESGWKTLFIHGLALFFISLIAGIPGYLLMLALPSVTTSIGVLVSYSFVDGFIAKNVAFLWEEESVSGASERGRAPSESTDQSSRGEEEEAELIFDKLLAKYVQHWGTQLGAELLNNEIKAYTWHGETFAEAVRRVYERQKKAGEIV